MKNIESYRLELRNKLIMIVGLGLMISVVLLTILDFTFFWVPFAFVLAAILYSLYYAKYNNKYKKYVKGIVLKDELEAAFSDVVVDFERGFSSEEIEGYRLVDTYSLFESDDYIEGKYQDCFFKRSDIHIQEIVRTGKSTTRVTKFKGQWLIMNFNKKFSNYTVIKEKEMLNNGKPGGFFNSRASVEKIEFEDERFNKQFIVYTTDGQEAFYLLTPHFMEKIIELESKHDGRVYIGFIDNQLHVAIDSRENLFELSLFEKFDDQYLKQIKNEIKIITDLIQDLN